MFFGLIGGLVIGGGAAYLQLQQSAIQFDVAITIGLLVVLNRFARSVAGWGLLIGVAAVFAMWTVVLGGGFVGTFEQTLDIYSRLFEGFPDKWIILIEDIAFYVARYDLRGDVPAEGVMGIWALEALAVVIAALTGAASGKRAKAGHVAPEAPAPARAPARRPAASPWKSRAAAPATPAEPAQAPRRPARRAVSRGASPKLTGQVVAPIVTPTIIDIRYSRDARRGGIYVN